MVPGWGGGGGVGEEGSVVIMLIPCSDTLQCVFVTECGSPKCRSNLLSGSHRCGFGSVCFLGLLDPDPLVRCADPDPSIKQK
jgi:hypothetical protein